MEREDVIQVCSSEAREISIVDEKQGIATCCQEDIPKWVTNLGPVKTAAFFYDYANDLIVLNADHTNYEFYKMIVDSYVTLNAKAKKEVMREALKIDAEINTKMYEALEILKYIVRIRWKLNKRKMLHNLFTLPGKVLEHWNRAVKFNERKKRAMCDVAH